MKLDTFEGIDEPYIISEFQSWLNTYTGSDARTFQNAH
jgi:hypothetical protein